MFQHYVLDETYRYHDIVDQGTDTQNYHNGMEKYSSLVNFHLIPIVIDNRKVK